jgi:hypothetical protein
MKPPVKRPGTREPRMAMNRNLTIVDEAEEQAILAIMRPWPGLQEDRLRAVGYDSFADGDVVLQEMFEHKLKDPRVPDALVTVKWLAERGFRSAQAALSNYATAVLEDGAANPPASIRSYLINLLHGLVPSHPPDPPRRPSPALHQGRRQPEAGRQPRGQAEAGPERERRLHKRRAPRDTNGGQGIEIIGARRWGGSPSCPPIELFALLRALSFAGSLRKLGT